MKARATESERLKKFQNRALNSEVVVFAILHRRLPIVM